MSKHLTFILLITHPSHLFQRENTISNELAAHLAGEVTMFPLVVCNLGVMNQQLIKRSINLGLMGEVKCLQHIDRQLLWLFYKSQNFDVIGVVKSGRTLLVGEGNLSFALSLVQMLAITPHQLVATTFEKINELSEDTLVNAGALKTEGVTVLHGVDASNLSITFGSWRFDNIIFQFPHTGSREGIDGHNPNFILVRDFLLSAAMQLNRGGQVLISAVDSPHYRGAFQFEEAAAIAGFNAPTVYPFDPNEFRGYTHVMTHQNSSALDHHQTFSTWVFKK